jgi:hypothetical protein
MPSQCAGLPHERHSTTAASGDRLHSFPAWRPRTTWVWHRQDQHGAGVALLSGGHLIRIFEPVHRARPSVGEWSR